MGSIVVVVVFPLLEAFGDEVRIVDDFTFVSRRCQWKAEPNSWPLSVWTFSTWNGSFERT